MFYCSECGTKSEKEGEFCVHCGAKIPTKMEEQIKEENKKYAVLSYIWILALIPMFTDKQSSFVKFHAKQGAILAIIEIGYGVVNVVLHALLLTISWRFFYIVDVLNVPNLLFLVLSIIGICNAIQGREKELPLLGKWKLLK